MKLRNLLLAGLFSVSLATTGLNGTDRPNILFLSVDDLKPLIGAYGRDEVPTPNMDRLAAAGTVMLNNHCQQAICAPSRMSMFTGLRPDSTKVWDLRTHIQDANPEAVTMQEWFKEAGYTTTGAGKVMHGARAEHPPSWSEEFTHRKDLPFNPNYPIPAHDNGFYQNEKSQRVYQELEAKGITHWKERGEYMREHDAMPSTESMDVPDDAYTDGALAVWANQLLDTYAQTKEPFFVTVGIAKPHLPFVAPKKYWDLFNRDEIQLAEYQEHAANSPDYAYHQFGELRSYTDIPRTWNEPIAEDKQRELIHGYYACVAYIDAQIGKILDKLEATGLDKNTIIVLWGDHGYHLGDHGMWNKHSNFEQATFAPLIITAPGYEGNQKTSGMTEMVDIFPTLVELAGLEDPAYELEGKSLVPVMKNPSVSIKDYAISQYPRQGNRMGYALRNERYRLVLWMKNDWRSTLPYNESLLDAVELYDYETDPLETVNYANDPAYASVVADLKAQMLDYFAQHVEEPETFKGTTVEPEGSGEFIDLNTIDFAPNTLRFATATIKDGKLELAFENSPKWPSVDIMAPGDQVWDLSNYGKVDIQLTNHSPFTVKTIAYVANPGDSNANKMRAGIRADIAAGETTTMSIDLSSTEGTLDASQLKQIRIFVNKVQGATSFTVHSITASGSAAPAKGNVGTTSASTQTASISDDGALLDLSDVNQLDTFLRFTELSNTDDGILIDYELSPKWPSAEFLAGNGATWDLSKASAVEVTLTNLGSTTERIFTVIGNPSADKNRSNAPSIGTGRVDVSAGETKTIRLPITRKDGFDPSKVEFIRLFTGMHKAPVKIKLIEVKTVGTASVQSNTAPSKTNSTAVAGENSVQPSASGELLDLSDVNQLKTDLRFSKVSNAPDGVLMEIELSPKWPSVEFFAGNRQTWDLSGYNYVEATMSNLGSEPQRVFIYVSNPAKDYRNKKTAGSGRVDFSAGETKTIRFSLNEGDEGFNPADVEAFRVFTGKHTSPLKLKLTSLKAVK